MKRNSVGVLCFLVLACLLLSSSSTSSRLLLQINHGEEEVNTNGMTIQSGAKEDLSDVIECQEPDEECESRRMLEEAHLDYIYTQNHKP